MTDRFKVFFCEATGRSSRSLRRYARRDDQPCPGGYHNAHTPLDEVTWGEPGSEISPPVWTSHLTPELAARPDWPVKCEHCDYVFVEDDERQLFSRSIYRNASTGEEFTLGAAPSGSVWNAWWMSDWRRGPDGRCLVVQTPAGEWMVDSRASNCTKPADDEHRCWVRHGKPEDGTLHVDKNGLTCAAGAGSIDMNGRWHGFLHSGELYRC